jgi:hypothetical protein
MYLTNIATRRFKYTSPTISVTAYDNKTTNEITAYDNDSTNIVNITIEEIE